MNKTIEKALEFEVDKLTNSIENALTGEVFDTAISRLSVKDSRKIKKADWLFRACLKIKKGQKKRVSP